MPQNKIENYMELATVAAKRSHDAETQVGAILVKNDTGAVVATGFNGFVRGAPDDMLPTTRPDKYEFMMHAEENIISHCARLGISMNNCTLVCTLSPCKRCTRLLHQCGITTVLVKKKYSDFDTAKLMPDITVTEESEDNGYIKIRYQNKT